MPFNIRLQETETSIPKIHSSTKIYTFIETFISHYPEEENNYLPL